MTRFFEIQISSIQSKKPAYFTSLPTFLPIFLITWWFDFASIAMERFFPIRAAAPTDDVILAPKSINPGANESQEFDEFRLYGRQYIWYGSLAKKPKNTKQRTSPIWRWGEDIFLRDSDKKMIYFYCWLCEKQK